MTRSFTQILPLLISLILVLACGTQAKTQDTEQIGSATFTSTSIEDILDQLETIYQTQIFHPDDNSELIRVVSIRFEDKSLDFVLDNLLSETTFGHVKYSTGGYVLLPKYVIEEEYSADFYSAMDINEAMEEEKGEEITAIGSVATLSSNGRAMIKGNVKDKFSGESVIGATITLEGASGGTTTDFDGNYEMEMPAGRQRLVINTLGYDETLVEVNILGDGDLDIELLRSAIQLEEVTITSESADASVERSQIGVETIDIKSIEKLPTFLGEVDVVKSFLLQPGVSSMGEGASGFNVRGGDVDQNLILQDNGMLFNSSHALGFFSTFNSEFIRSVKLFKGNLPAQYGGRLASVMDVEMRDGNFDEFKIKAGIGPVSSRVMIEGPIIKDKLSFIVGGRSSYADWILGLIKTPLEVNRSSAFFYDGNARLTFKPNEKNTVILSGYTSTDRFTYNEEFGFEYSTTSGELNVKTIISDELFSNFSATASSYESSQFDLDGIDARQLDNDVKHVKVREELRYVKDSGLEIIGGAEAILYEINPGDSQPFGDLSVATRESLNEDKGLEAAIFVNAEYEINDDFTINGGIRLNHFRLNGPREVFQYENPSRPRSDEILGSEVKTGTIATYSNIEPRVSMRYKLGEGSSVKMGYARTSQFINQIFNTDSPTPTSQWQLSTDYIEPLRSHNVSVGYFRNLGRNKWETSIEIYGRYIDQLYDYIDFADLTVNPHIETELATGIGRTYGAELSIKKVDGVVNGWFSYTYSKSERKLEDVNDGLWYASNFDKPHDMSLVFNYNPNKRNTYTVNFNYGTGRPTTAPVGNYVSDNGLLIPVFDRRNSQRIPDYLRLDLAYTLGQGYKKDAKFKTSWTISVYNVLGRRNPFSVFFTQGAFQGAQANKLSVLGTIFPSITMNIELL